MKFVVDDLPYYGDLCPFSTMCSDNANDDKCPRYWNKYKICSDDNPHECQLLTEITNIERRKVNEIQNI